MNSVSDSSREEGISAPFIRRPIATVLLTAAVALAGFVAFLQLPTAPLPQVDFPTINVSANLPGASPDIMASAVAAPLERQLAHIAGLSERYRPFAAVLLALGAAVLRGGVVGHRGKH